MAAKVQRDKELEQQRPAGVFQRKENKQTSCGAPVGDHVEHCAELRTLVKAPRKQSIKCIQEARNAVQNSARHRVVPHIKERECRENHTRIAWSARHAPIKLGTKRNIFSWVTSVTPTDALCGAGAFASVAPELCVLRFTGIVECIDAVPPYSADFNTMDDACLDSEVRCVSHSL